MSTSRASQPKDEIIQRQFQFIDDRERLHNPALRKAVRSAARKHSSSTSFPGRPRPTKFTLPRKLEKASNFVTSIPHSEPRKSVQRRRRSIAKVPSRKALYEACPPLPRSPKHGVANELQQILPPQRKPGLGATNPFSAATDPFSTAIDPFSGAIDPFYSLPVKMQPYMYRLLENYISVLCWRPNDKIHDELANTHKKWFHLCLQSEMSLKIILSMAESGSRRSRGLDPWSPLAISLMVDAYALFNKALNNPKEITDSMFTVVGNLAAGELAAGNYKKYQSHINGMTEMIKVRGGLAKVDEHIKRMFARIHNLGGEIMIDEGKKQTAVQHLEQRSGITRLCPRPQSPASSELLRVLKLVLSLSKDEIFVTEAAILCLKSKLSSISADRTTSTLEQTIIIATSIYIDFVLHHISPNDIKWNSKIHRQLVLSTMQPYSQRDMDENSIVLEWVSEVSRTTFFVGLIDWDPERQRTTLIEKLEGAVRRLEGLGD